MELKDKNPRDGINTEGLTPRHYAACRGHLKIVKSFIHYQIEKNTVDGMGFTPLHYAAMMGHLETCKFLMEDNLEKKSC